MPIIRPITNSKNDFKIGSLFEDTLALKNKLTNNGSHCQRRNEQSSWDFNTKSNDSYQHFEDDCQ